MERRGVKVGGRCLCLTCWAGKWIRRGSESVKMHQSQLRHNSKMVRFRRVGGIFDGTLFQIGLFLS